MATRLWKTTLARNPSGTISCSRDAPQPVIGTRKTLGPCGYHVSARKNALFAGHDAGAENWACLASLIETCKLNGVDPQAYLTAVLTRLVNLWPSVRIDELMPWAWAGDDSSGGVAA